MTVQITGTRSTKRRSQKAEAYFHRNHTLSISYNIERQTDRTQYFIQDNISFKSITSNTKAERKIMKKRGREGHGGLVYLQVTGSSCLKVTFHTNFEGGQGFALLQGLRKGVPHVDGVAGERVSALFSVKSTLMMISGAASGVVIMNQQYNDEQRSKCHSLLWMWMSTSQHSFHTRFIFFLKKALNVFVYLQFVFIMLLITQSSRQILVVSKAMQKGSMSSHCGSLGMLVSQTLRIQTKSYVKGVNVPPPGLSGHAGVIDPQSVQFGHLAEPLLQEAQTERVYL